MPALALPAVEARASAGNRPGTNGEGRRGGRQVVALAACPPLRRRWLSRSGTKTVQASVGPPSADQPGGAQGGWSG
jgi:hypothetical protein